MTVQECFNDASEKYLQLRSFVAEMGKLVRGAIPDFNAHSAQCQLDIIVQYVLLKTALADGKFLPVEGEFIDKITDTFDILHLFKDCPDGLNWRWIADNNGFEEIKGVIGEVEQIAAEHMLYFAGLFACLDAAVTDVDCLSIMVEGIKGIAIDFVVIDGSAERVEAEVAATTIMNCLVRPWQEMIKKCKK